MHIYYLTVFMSRESGHSLSGSSASWSLSEGIDPGYTVSSEGLTGKRSASQSHPGSVSSIQFLKGCWTKDLNSSLAVGQRFLSFPCHMCLSHPAACFIKACKPRRQQRGSPRKVEVTIFCNSVTEVTACHLCHSLLSRTTSVRPAHTQGEKIGIGTNTNKRAKLRTILKSAYHIILFN